MATRTILKSWFTRGAYPRAEQFAGWIDSYWHKEEDTIPVAAVEGLPGLLNGKYAASDGELLAAAQGQLAEGLAALVLQANDLDARVGDIKEVLDEINGEEI
ncbi:MAG: hypothetical protein LBP56_07710 [Odoribacteraceae bacterium]|jgi:hypothetical protein|nr:hypothetical protein [Odoribacteraceae bacterium]